MICIVSEYTDPWFNLAAEEVLLRSRSDDYCLLYRNRPCVVVGKHQNALAEINFEFIRERKIPVFRRISGGGTVFHDLGNVNFAFITNGKEGELVDYARHTRPIIEAMAGLGLQATLGKRNEILLGNRKISGTASHVYKQRVLHHGTLLFCSEMKDLSDSLRNREELFRDRAVRSVRSGVTNIRDHLVDKMEVTDFRDRLLNHILLHMKGAEHKTFTPGDLSEIKKLGAGKFSTWEWNFGYSPKYQFNKTLSFTGGTLSIHMNVDRGIIREVSIQGDFHANRSVPDLEKLLEGTIHDPETLRIRLADVNVGEYVQGLENEQLLSGMF